MADYSMDDDAWNGKKADIDEWFEANPQHSDRKAITDGLFSIGDIQVDFRKRHWSAIAGVFSDLPNSPIGRGRQSLMDVAEKSHLDRYLGEYFDNMVSIFPMIALTARTHGKSGGILYADMENSAEEYATDQTKKERLFLNSAFNAGKSQNTEKRYWMSFNDEGYPVVVDNGGLEEE